MKRSKHRGHKEDKNGGMSREDGWWRLGSIRWEIQPSVTLCYWISNPFSPVRLSENILLKKSAKCFFPLKTHNDSIYSTLSSSLIKGGAIFPCSILLLTETWNIRSLVSLLFTLRWAGHPWDGEPGPSGHVHGRRPRRGHHLLGFSHSRHHQCIK